MNGTFTMAVCFKAKAQHSAEFGARLLDVVDVTRLDTGCIVFDVHQVQDDQNAWYLYEGWRSKEDSDTHMRKPVIQAFFAEWDRLLMEAPVPLMLDLKSRRSSPASSWPAPLDSQP